MENRNCAFCKQPFEISDEDLKFYQKIEMPTPTRCPLCRRLRRLLFRNDRKLYRRNCSLCKKSIIATYEEEAPFPVYCPDCWWSDKWDSSSFVQPIDFNRSFFEQWNELNKKVPHISLWQIQNQNSEYTHDASYNKNSYMLFGADYNQDCYYSWSMVRCKDCCDCSMVLDSERCYECVDCFQSQFSTHCQLVRNSSNCHFCFDLVNCHNCFGSSGLRNKSYYFFNEQLTKEQYEAKMREVEWTPEKIAEYKKQAFEKSLSLPRKYVIQKNCEESSGSYLGNCKNVNNSFDCESSRDVKYSLMAHETKDAYDGEVLFYNIEVVYDSQTLIKNCFRVFFSYFLRDAKEIYYSTECYASQNLFGCVGIRSKKYAILNKEYGAEEYERLKTQIIEKMKKEGQWGEFFPMEISPFYYNESAAIDYMPALNKAQATAYGLRWKDEADGAAGQQNNPDTLLCTTCGKAFRLIPQEINFYKNMKLPPPQNCFSCRHIDRIGRRGPRILFNRTCNKCAAPIRTSYAPNRPEIVYCEKCYLEIVY